MKQNQTLLLVLGVALLIAAGYVVMQNSTQQQPYTPPTPAVITVETTPSPEPAETGMMKKEEPITIFLTPDKGNNSTQAGTVILSQENGKVKVVIDASPMGSSQPAHIHKGKCPDVGDVVYPLTSVNEGKSETILDTTLADLRAKGDLAINIHKSAAEIKVYTSCGNLPR
jgi:hypothetical protein